MSYDDKILSLSPRAFYKLDDETSASELADSSGNDYHAPVTGTVISDLQGMMQFGKGVRFDTTWKATLPDLHPYIHQTATFCIAFWFKANHAQSADSFVPILGATLGAFEAGWGMTWDDRSSLSRSGMLYFNNANGAGSLDTLTANNALEDDNLHFVVIQGNAGAINLYIDGQLYTTTTFSAKTGTPDSVTLGEIEHSGTTYKGHFSMARLALWEAPLSEPDIAELYDLGINGDTGSPTTINGNIKIDDSPAQRDVIAISYNEFLVPNSDPAETRRQVVGSTTSDPITGNYLIQANYTGPVIVLAMDDYGSEWVADTYYDVGDLIHPTIPNGYVYECTVAGNSGPSQPAWWFEGAGSVGGATFLAKEYHRPLAHGPVMPELVQ